MTADGAGPSGFKRATPLGRDVRRVLALLMFLVALVSLWPLLAVMRAGEWVERSFLGRVVDNAVYSIPKLWTAIGMERRRPH